MSKRNKEKITINREVLKKYFNQKTFAGISAVGLVIVVMLYVFVFLNFQTKTEELERANAVKQKEVDELAEYYNNLPKYEADIKTMTEQMKDTLEQYPADVREEDILMLAVETQKESAIGYDTIQMEEAEVVLDIPDTLVANADMEDYTQGMQFVSRHASYANNTTYADLKSVIQTIYDADDRIQIDNIMYTKEEDGLLKGTIEMYFYSVNGTGKEYNPPEMEEYPAGTQDIFKSVLVTETADKGSEAYEADQKEN